jgi:ElaA protein
MTIEWVCKHHTDLGKEQLYAVLQLRTEVFVVEQKCPYQEVDGQDLEGDTCHLMAWQDDRLLAYLRLLDPTSQGGDVVIGRVVIAAEARGQGLGHELMEQALKQAEKHWPQTPIYLCKAITGATVSPWPANPTSKMAFPISACAGPEARLRPAANQG